MVAFFVFIIIVGGIMLGVHLHRVGEKRTQDDIDEIIFVERLWDQNRNNTGRSFHNDDEIMLDCNDDFFEMDEVIEVDDLLDT